MSRPAAEATALGGSKAIEGTMKLSSAAFLVLPGLSLLAGCARRSAEAVVTEPIMRCYDLTVSQWSPAVELRADTTFVIPPRAIALGPGPSASRLFKGWFAMSPAPGVRGTIHRHQAWKPEGEKPILRLMWTTGFSGVEAVVSPDGQGNLRGIARTRWDTERQRQKADIVLTQRSC